MNVQSLPLAIKLSMAGTPFPSLKVPTYEPVTFGDWILARNKGSIARGYFSGVQKMQDNWILSKRQGVKEKIWMSITPMELESAAHHVLSAKGHVLIGGGGMGLVAWNCAIKPEVTSVTVIERDFAIIELLNHLANKHKWSCWEKVSIIADDILSADLPSREWDVALIDIWPGIGDERIRPDLQVIARHIKAKEYAAWSQELDFVTWAMERHPRLHVNEIAPHHWQEYSKDIGVPLIQPHPDMAHLAVQATFQCMYLSERNPF